MVRMSRKGRGGGWRSLISADAVAYSISICLVLCIVALFVVYVTYLDTKGQLVTRDQQRLKGAVPADGTTSTLKQVFSPTMRGDEDNKSDDESVALTHDKVHLVYGTAWKKDETARLVAAAIRNGFRFIDTACQPKHYNEAGVGEGWTAAAAELNLQRSHMYLQTKFTSVDGQDPTNIPYNKHAPITDQVKESLQISLSNLRTSYLDAWLMHSPFPHMEDTLEAYGTMETAVDEGKVRLLGISNIYNFSKLKHIYENARIKPSIIQNRFYSDSGFDAEIRAFCQSHKMVYQSFWTLSANRQALSTLEIRKLAQAKLLTPQTLMYAYMMLLGGSPPTHTPLDGTTNETHMREDISVQNRIRKGEKILAEDEIYLVSRVLGVVPQ